MNIFFTLLCFLMTNSLFAMEDTSQSDCQFIYTKIRSIADVLDYCSCSLEAESKSKDEKKKRWFKQSTKELGTRISLFVGSKKKIRDKSIDLAQTLILVDFDETLARTELHLNSGIVLKFAGNNERGRTFRDVRKEGHELIAYNGKDIISDFPHLYDLQYEALEPDITDLSLRQWLKAGASVVVCSGKLCTQSRIDFLATLLGSDEHLPCYLQVNGNKISALEILTQDNLINWNTISNIIFVDNFDASVKSCKTNGASVSDFLAEARKSSVCGLENIKNVIGMHLTLFEDNFDRERYFAELKHFNQVVDECADIISGDDKNCDLLDGPVLLDMK